jgi:hypothetical protein
MKFELSEVLTHPVVAAAVGAVVGLRALPGTSMLEKAANVGAGFAIAAWGGAAAVDYMQIASPKLASGMIFVIGAVGLVIFNALVEAIKNTDLGAWLGSWLPRRKGGE